MKVRIWDEPWTQRVLPTPDAPLVVNKGQIVTVTITDSWEEAADALRSLMLQLKRTEPVGG